MKYYTFVLLNFLDLTTTLFALRLGAAEGNPFAQNWIDKYGVSVLIPVKLSATLFMIGLWQIVNSLGPMWEKIAWMQTTGLNMLLGAIVGNNLFVLLEKLTDSFVTTKPLLLFSLLVFGGLVFGLSFSFSGSISSRIKEVKNATKA